MEDEELLDSGGPRVPRWMRLSALVAAGLAVAALIAVTAWPRSGSPPRAATSRPPTLYTLIPQPGASSPPSPTRALPPWPTAPGACGADVSLPIVSSTPVAGRTGIRLLLGGNRLRVVDFDSGRASMLAGVTLRPGEYVVGLNAASTTYAVTGGGCQESSTSRVLRIEPGGRTTTVASLGTADGLLTDGDRAWIVRNPTDVHHPNGSITPLGGGAAVRLPSWVYPFDVVSGVLVAQLQQGDSCPCSLVLVDAATGHIRATFGAGASSVASGAGLLVWSEGCDATVDKPCVLHARTVASAATGTYRLPRPTFGGIVSPDGRLVAVILERATQDPRFARGHPSPPSDIAILHLDTGRLDIAPGIEVPAKSFPEMAFSADGRWLLMAFDAGSKTRLLTWRPGLAHPYEPAPVAGLGWGPPPIVPLP